MLLGGHIGARASDLLDGRLEWAEEERLREHLGRCAGCAAVVQAERDARMALRCASSAEACPGPPPDLLAGLLALSTGAAERPVMNQPVPDQPAMGLPNGPAPLGSRPMLGAGPALGASAAQPTGHGLRVKGTLLMTTVIVSAATVAGASAMTPQASRRAVVPPGAQVQVGQPGQLTGSRAMPIVAPTANR